MTINSRISQDENCIKRKLELHFLVRPIAMIRTANAEGRIYENLFIKVIKTKKKRI